MATLLSALVSIPLASLIAWAPPTDPPEASASPEGTVEGPSPPTLDKDPEQLRLEAFGELPNTIPFETEALQLSEVLQIAIDENIDLQSRVIALEISEANIMAALGAYDVTLTAGVEVSVSRDTPRGSEFIFNTGSRTLSGYLGVARRLETGGNISLRFDVSRSLSDQPISIFNPQAGSATLARYTIRPTLTFTHPLMRGFGIRVNRAQVERSRLARSTAEADQLNSAQTVVRDLISAYWDVLYAEHDLANKHQAVALAKQQLERTQAQVRAGRLAAIEAKAVEQSVAQRETDVLLAENQLLDASLRLRTLMGQEFADRDALGVLAATKPEAFVAEPVDVDAAIERALANNPTVRQLEVALATKRIDEIEAANQRLPQLDFTGTFSPTGRSVDQQANPQQGILADQGSWGEAFQNFVTEDPAEDGLFAQYTVTGALDFSWSIQNRTAKGNHQRVLAELRQAELNLKQIRQTTASSVILAANNIRSSAKRFDLALLSVDLAEQNLAAEQARFEVGRSTNYDVLFRIDELTTAQTTALQARLDYLRAKLELQMLTGEILPAYGLDLPGGEQ